MRPASRWRVVLYYQAPMQEPLLIYDREFVLWRNALRWARQFYGQTYVFPHAFRIGPDGSGLMGRA